MSKIKFAVPKTVNTRVVLYDILGKEVATVIDDRLNPGEYELDIKSTNLPDGTYFYKVIFEGKSETKKMILIN